jgi:hypothetical protein
MVKSPERCLFQKHFPAIFFCFEKPFPAGRAQKEEILKKIAVQKKTGLHFS